MASKKAINWHAIIQDLFDEHMETMSGKRILFRSREFHKRSRMDYLCEADPESGPPDDGLVYPFGHLNRYNVIEIKSHQDTLQVKDVQEYIGRAFDVLALGKDDRRGKVSLTIVSTRFPRKFFRENSYPVVKIYEWLYRIDYIPDLPIYIVVLRHLRGQKLGTPTAFLQALEDDPRYQWETWDVLMESDDAQVEALKCVIMKIDKEGFMTYRERLIEEGKQLAAHETQRERELRLKAEAELEKKDSEIEKKDSVIERLKEELQRFGCNPDFA